MIGTKLGSYEIVDELGGGGMGRVYKAHQKALGRMVAVKTLLPQFANDSVFVERFLREARAIAALEHPGIVTVYDVGESEGTYYFAMQFLSGRTLEEVIGEEGALSAETILPIVRELAAALGYAHAAGILHRDVKPGNIFITDEERVVLTDFGIAWAASQTRLTVANTSLGSPGYMAPEQVEGKTLDARADLYSLGVVLFEMLTGETPYKGDSAVSIAYQHVRAPVPAAGDVNAEADPSLAALAERLMSKSPDDRHSNADDLVVDLGRIERGDYTPAIPGIAGGRRAIGLAAGAAVVVLGIAGWLLFGRSDGGGASDAAAPDTAVAAEATPEEADAPEAIGSDGEAAPDTEGQNPPTAEIGTAPAEELEAGEPGATEEAVAVRSFRITSQPPGAAVLVNGEELDQRTPTSVNLEPTVEYQVTLRLDGYDPAGWSFALEDLSDAQDRSGVLHFPLQSSVPPALLTVAAAYPVNVEIGGDSFQGPIEELELEPGSYSVRLEAPAVFYSETRQIDLAAGAAETLELPALAPLTVAATPSRCRVRIDGRDAGYVPIQLDIAVGTHEFLFDWENLGKTLALTRAITAETDRVFAAAPSP